MLYMADLYNKFSEMGWEITNVSNPHKIEKSPFGLPPIKLTYDVAALFDREHGVLRCLAEMLRDNERTNDINREKIEKENYPIYKKEINDLMKAIEKEIAKQEKQPYKYIFLSQMEFKEMYQKAQAAGERLVLKGYYLHNVSFKEMKCVGVDFIDCDMSSRYICWSCIFLDCSFQNVNMTNIYALGVEFNGCRFINVDAHWGVFIESRFYSCERNNSNFSNIRLDEGDLVNEEQDILDKDMCEYEKMELDLSVKHTDRYLAAKEALQYFEQKGDEVMVEKYKNILRVAWFRLRYLRAKPLSDEELDEVLNRKW